MKGATAEPFDNTSSEPNSSIIMKIGNSQNFFRTRRNIQNSPRNESISDLRADGFTESGRTPMVCERFSKFPQNYRMSAVNPEQISANLLVALPNKSSGETS